MSGIEDRPQHVTCIGDLPIVAIDSKGKRHRLVIKGVRCVPSFTETLISVDSLWEDFGTEVRFAGHRKIYLRRENSQSRLSFPFKRASDRLYVWEVTGECRLSDPEVHQSTSPSPEGLEGHQIALLAAERPFDIARFHRPKSRSHLESLDAQSLAATLHHRLHVSSNVLQRLGEYSADVSSKIGKLEGAPCPHCVEANATRFGHHAPPVYKPSYVGRLIHADIVGPFRVSIVGHFKYILVLTDDHSRFKSVYFLRNKSEALSKVKCYVASVNAHVSQGKPAPVKVVGSLHTDNAGEFLSHEFKEFMDQEAIQQTTCPPHIHSLNGVAERAIRSIIENARSHIVASGAPNSFWPYAVEHAVDVLNRCTGPPDSDRSSYELMHGRQPNVLPLQAFGCRAVAVLPRVAYSKTELDSHGVAGINLGLCPNMTSSYRVWIPSRGKIVNTSDVYFDETFMPWRGVGDQRVGPVVPHAAPHDEAPHSLAAVSPPPPLSVPIAGSIGEAFDVATRTSSATARSSNKVLVLFSGPYNRPDSLAFFLKRNGLDPELVDNGRDGGDPNHDLLNDSFYHSLLARVQSGAFCCIFAAPPCSTFSVSRFYEPKDGKPGPQPVRDRKHPDGLPNLSPSLKRELLEANGIVSRTCAILAAGWQSGTQFAVESPIDRGDEAYPRHFLTARHRLFLADLAHVRSNQSHGGQTRTLRAMSFRCSRAEAYQHPLLLRP